jgi:hypothetical protein
MAEQHFQPSMGRGIVSPHRLDIFEQRFQHGIPLKKKAPTTGGRRRSMPFRQRVPFYPLVNSDSVDGKQRQIQLRQRT